MMRFFLDVYFSVTENVDTPKNLRWIKSETTLIALPDNKDNPCVGSTSFT